VVFKVIDGRRPHLTKSLSSILVILSRSIKLPRLTKVPWSNVVITQSRFDNVAGDLVEVDINELGFNVDEFTLQELGDEDHTALEHGVDRHGQVRFGSVQRDF
jgi:hypothetical protein